MKVENNVPVEGEEFLPARQFPWRQMKSGSSFLVPVDKPGTKDAHLNQRRRSVMASGKAWLKRNGRALWKIETRKVEGGFRVWLFDEKWVGEE
jgi:hypothetical protein